MEKRVRVRSKTSGQVFDVVESDAYYILPEAWCGEVLGAIDLAYRKDHFEVIDDGKRP